MAVVKEDEQSAPKRMVQKHAQKILKHYISIP